MENKLIIRRFKEDDIDELYTMIHKSLNSAILKKVYENSLLEIWQSLYTKKYLLSCSKMKHLYVATLNKQIVGSCAINNNNNKGYISVVYIDPDTQGKGIGKAMMQAIEKDEIALETKYLYLHAAISATKFYQKLGYKYHNNIPEIILDCGVDFIELEKKITLNN